MFLHVYILLFADLNVDMVEGASRLAGDSETWNSNDIGIMCSFAAVMSLYLKKTFKKNIYLANLLFLIPIAFMTGSRKTFIILILSVALFYVFSAKRGKLLNTMLAIITIVFSYYLVMSVPSLYDSVGIRIESMLNVFTGVSTIDSSTRLRMNMIEYGLIWFKEKPLLGVGIDNYRYLWHSVSGVAMYAHNNYIEILVDLGIVGFIVYYSIYISAIRKLTKSLKYDRYFFAVALSILLTLATVEMSLVSYNYRFIQIILCLVLCITRIPIKKH